jgi:hypothetical protein
MKNFQRIGKVLSACVQDYTLNLRGLTVLTEAATGAYLCTPIVAALAGAEKVYAVAADSAFATKEEVAEQTIEAAKLFEVASKIEIVFEKTKRIVEASDIITNSGFVRPITSRIVSWMKPTAVIPLMWETWEFRESDLDLEACRQNDILVLGTDESKPPLSMYSCGFYLAMKLLFELGLEGYKTKTLLLGGGRGLGQSIYQRFQRLDMKVSWFAKNEPGARSFEELRDEFLRDGTEYDLILVAEHEHNIRLLGARGLLTYEEIRNKNPAVAIGVISGNIDGEELASSGLPFFPSEVRPFRFMSYQPYDLGPRPVLELYAAGLKVGEAMARARLSGSSVKEAARHALQNSAAMDFQGDRAWL